MNTIEKLNKKTGLEWSDDQQSCNPYAVGDKYDYMVTEPALGATWRLDWWSLWVIEGRNFESFDEMVEFVNGLEGEE